MQLSQEQAGKYFIRSFEPGSVTVNEQSYTHSILIDQNGIKPWEITQFSEINENTLAPLLNIEIEMIIIGAGPNQQFLPPHLLALFMHKKIGIEVMTSIAACRTYNILTSEGRDVLLALIV